MSILPIDDSQACTKVLLRREEPTIHMLVVLLVSEKLSSDVSTRRYLEFASGNSDVGFVSSGLLKSSKAFIPLS